MSNISRIHLTTWPAADLARALRTNDVVVCTASLLHGPDELHSALGLLAADEQKRYEELLNPIVARRFAIGRLRLRTTLGNLLCVAPRDVRLRSGLHGKPELVPSAYPASLWFSVAHTDDVMLIAASRSSWVGVDIERRRSMEQWERLASRVLDASERQALERAVIGGGDPSSEFLRLWCRVEAELKAIGVGIVGLEAHREGLRPLALRVMDLPVLPLPFVADQAHYQAAVALCAPSVASRRHNVAPMPEASAPVMRPARASTP